MPLSDADIRLAALEAMTTRLLLAAARERPDPPGALDALAGELRRHAETMPLDSADEAQDRLRLAAALLQLVTHAKERLIAEQLPPA